jgi:hypothetical protein
MSEKANSSGQIYYLQKNNFLERMGYTATNYVIFFYFLNEGKNKWLTLMKKSIQYKKSFEK